MNINYFLLMRHELLLIFVAVVILIAEIFSKNKNGVINIALILFTLVTIVGFIPVEGGQLFGGSFQSSNLTSIVKNILNIGVLIVFLQSVDYLKKEENLNKVGEFFALILFTLVGMDYMVSSGDFLMFYLGLETASIPAAGLVAFDKYKNESAEAGVKLILLSALSSGILLFGISMIYAATGSIYFADIIPHITASPIILLGLVFFVSGIGFKISLVPFHMWTADVYEGAPVGITAYLSVVSKGAAVFIFALLLFTVFKSLTEIWENLLYALAILTMTIGNLFAIRQNNLKRFLAFSSIAQAGFILLGIMGNSAVGMTSVVYFILIYTFTNLGAFGVVQAISNKTGVETISGYNGLYFTNPKLSLVMLLSLFSLAGIPPVAGFFGKFFLFTSAASSGYYILVLVAVLNATISLYYYLRVVKAMMIDKNDNPIPKFKSSFYTRVGILMPVVGIFVIGFLSIIFEYIKSAANYLF